MVRGLLSILKKSEMSAVSKKQQRFFGMVRATQKGEMENPSPEVAQAAASASMSDVKKFASTKHKGLPEKKVAKEAYYGGVEQKKKDEKKKKIDAFMNMAVPKRTFDQMGRETDRRTGKLKEAQDFSQRDKIMKKAKPLHKHLYNRLHKKDTSGDVNESRYDRYDAEKKRFDKDDKKMKNGKRWKEFTRDIESAKKRLRPGEVKKFNKETGKYESNKD